MKIEPGLFVFAATISGFSAEPSPPFKAGPIVSPLPLPILFRWQEFPNAMIPAAYRKYIEQSYI